MLGFTKPSVLVLSALMLGGRIPIVVILYLVILMPNASMLNVRYTDSSYAEYHIVNTCYTELLYIERCYLESSYTERHYTECHYAECRGTIGNYV